MTTEQAKTFRKCARDLIAEDAPQIVAGILEAARCYGGRTADALKVENRVIEEFSAKVDSAHGIDGMVFAMKDAFYDLARKYAAQVSIYDLHSAAGSLRDEMTREQAAIESHQAAVSRVA